MNGITMHRIEIYPLNTPSVPDTRGHKLAADLAATWQTLKAVTVVDVYTTDHSFSTDALTTFADNLHNPVSQRAHIHNGKAASALPPFDMALEIGFLPGVTDNVGHTAQQIAEDITGQAFGEDEHVYSSQLFLLEGIKDKAQVQKIAKLLANPLIQRIHVKSAEAFHTDGGMDVIAPQVHLHERIEVDSVNLEVSDDELLKIGTSGIANPDGTRRGPLGLPLLYMQAIQAYFRDVEQRDPSDIELETLAQTWSEHCKHTIFADPIDDIEDGIYRHYIKRATIDIRAAKGEDDFCISVFTDNSGAIIFDDEWLVTDKAETHNSPSALDPFGGAITGIVGVNRDTMGFGLGAKPVLNRYGYCFADPSDTTPLYKDKALTTTMLSPAFIMDGVVHGVNVGGNCSGIPSPQGFAYFDARFRGKPLVFAGTVGLIPRTINGKPGHIKSAQAGDKIVMAGGRVGKDGIHGATFSSVALDEGSPATAVQIGDPITQKKMSDAIIKEARDKDLYHAITDNGAGGLSSSVGEMAEGSGGFILDLDTVPLKYPGMAPWEIWISESQERMTLAIPPENVDEFIALLKKRDVDAWIVGEFTDSGRAVIRWHGEDIMDMSMEFLHDGLPKRQQQTKFIHVPHYKAFDKTPPVPARSITDQSIKTVLPALLSSLNICSRSFIATQYDHEVQASSILKPLQGKGRVFAEATVSRPVLTSQKGIVTSQGILPRYSDVDTYHMAACSIDSAIRAAVAAGANPDHMAIMDNFCWCSSDEPERLYQLKRAAEACYDYATTYGTPFISGKDSMFNDFKGFDADGNAVKISVPPTLLISTLSVIPDISRTVSMEAKQAGDIIYVIGDTYAEMGASEYRQLLGEIGRDVPTVDAEAALDRYRAYYQAVQNDLINAAIPVGLGGLAVALAKLAIAGDTGINVSPKSRGSLDELTWLYSESQSRILVTVTPAARTAFEEHFASHGLHRLGEVSDDRDVKIGDTILPLDVLAEAYHSPLAGY